MDYLLRDLPAQDPRFLRRLYGYVPVVLPVHQCVTPRRSQFFVSEFEALAVARTTPYMVNSLGWGMFIRTSPQASRLHSSL